MALSFLDGLEYVLIYEDHEGDFMLVGNVAWKYNQLCTTLKTCMKCKWEQSYVTNVGGKERNSNVMLASSLQDSGLSLQNFARMDILIYFQYTFI